MTTNENQETEYLFLNTFLIALNVSPSITIVKHGVFKYFISIVYKFAYKLVMYLFI
jgi:hypothetical protein